MLLHTTGRRCSVSLCLSLSLSVRTIGRRRCSPPGRGRAGAAARGRGARARAAGAGAAPVACASLCVSRPLSLSLSLSGMPRRAPAVRATAFRRPPSPPAAAAAAPPRAATALAPPRIGVPAGPSTAISPVPAARWHSQPGLGCWQPSPPKGLARPLNGLNARKRTPPGRSMQDARCSDLQNAPGTSFRKRFIIHDASRTYMYRDSEFRECEKCRRTMRRSEGAPGGRCQCSARRERWRGGRRLAAVPARGRCPC